MSESNPDEPSFFGVMVALGVACGISLNVAVPFLFARFESGIITFYIVSVVFVISAVLLRRNERHAKLYAFLLGMAISTAIGANLCTICGILINSTSR